MVQKARKRRFRLVKRTGGTKRAVKEKAEAYEKEKAEAVEEGALAVFFGDAHLSRRIWNKRREIEGDAEFALSQLSHVAMRYGVSMMISAGDLFDEDEPDSYTVMMYRRWLDDLEVNDVKFAHVQGNHDKQLVAWPKAISGSAIHLHRRQIDLGNFTLLGLDYQPPNKLEHEIKRLPKSDIYVCHQAWKEVPGSGQPDGSVEWFNNKRCTIFTGDLHANVEVDVARRRVISPGATHMRGIDEPDRFFCYLLTKDGLWIRKPIASRLIKRATVNSEAELDALLAEWPDLVTTWIAEGKFEYRPESVRKPLLIIRFPQSLEGVQRRVNKVVGDAAHVIVKPVVEKDDSIRDSDAPVKLRGNLVSYVENRIPKSNPNHGHLVSLIESSDKKAAVADLRRSFGL